MDRIDLHIDVPPVSARDLALPPPAEGSRHVAARVAAARALQLERYEGTTILLNAHADGDLLQTTVALSEAGRALLMEAADRTGLTARGYHRVLRVARTLADLDQVGGVERLHIAEALSYRSQTGGSLGAAA